jgi:hypothetical protein
MGSVQNQMKHDQKHILKTTKNLETNANASDLDSTGARTLAMMRSKAQKKTIV